MGRYFGWVFAVGLAVWISPAPAAAQVRVGVHTPNVGVSVDVGSPRVYVVDRHYDPYYRGRPYRRAPVVVVRERDYRKRDREYRKEVREYRKDVREARREYEKDLREARRDYERDIREARRDRRR